MGNGFFVEHSLYQKEVDVRVGSSAEYFEKNIAAQFPFCCYWTHDSARTGARVSWYWHWHRDVEWIAVQEGTLDYYVGDQKVRIGEGEGIFVNSGALHNVETEGGYGYICLRAAPGFLASMDSLIYQKCISPIVDQGSPFIALRQDVDWQAGLLEHIRGIERICRNTAGGTDDTGRVEMELLLRYCELWYDLLRNGSEALSCTRSARELETQERLHTMMRYIWDHYTEHITLDEIAAAANISKSSALRSFQSGIQSTPIQYLNTYRLQRAKELLSSTIEPVSSVALSVGFDNIGYFDRLFKRENGVTPQRFRRAITAQQANA